MFENNKKKVSFSAYKVVSFLDCKPEYLRNYLRPMRDPFSWKNIFMEWKTDITLETTLPLRKETIIYYCNFRPQFFLKILKKIGDENYNNK